MARTPRDRAASPRSTALRSRMASSYVCTASSSRPTANGPWSSRECTETDGKRADITGTRRHYGFRRRAALRDRRTEAGRDHQSDRSAGRQGSKRAPPDPICPILSCRRIMTCVPTRARERGLALRTLLGTGLCSLWYTACEEKPPLWDRGLFLIHGAITSRSLPLRPDPWHSPSAVAAGLRVDPACR